MSGLTLILNENVKLYKLWLRTLFGTFDISGQVRISDKSIHIEPLGKSESYG